MLKTDDDDNDDNCHVQQMLMQNFLQTSAPSISNTNEIQKVFDITFGNL